MAALPEAPLVENFHRRGSPPRRWPGRIVWWDETLRDGEQTPGVYYTHEEKLELARMISASGVDVMNVGIPAISPNELKAVKAIANEGLEASILGAARTVRSDIDAVIQSDAPEIATFIAASEVHLRHKLNMTKERALEVAVDSVEYARDHGLKVTFVTEDTVRADMDFVQRLYQACIDAGAQRVLFCDTVGVMTPSTFGWWLDEMVARIQRPKVEYGVHVHNDFGMAVANSLTALEHGIPCVNTTVNGIGERAGNASFEELVMALETLYGVDTHIDRKALSPLSRRVEEVSGVPVAFNKAVVGSNAFTHESGIHTDGVIKNTLTYEPMQVEELGRRRRFVFGKHTGTRAVEARLQEAGLSASKEQLLAIANEIKTYTEAHTKEAVREFIQYYRAWDRDNKGVSPEVFWRIAAKHGVAVPKPIPATA
ncbi:MAG TPA: homoaconitate hydratase [Candidatus Thermoplasmatota archaeon]|nr:homoaconitate hydratase [Candidatus Thermoplasmatota archaeon]